MSAISAVSAILIFSILVFGSFSELEICEASSVSKALCIATDVQIHGAYELPCTSAHLFFGFHSVAMLHMFWRLI